jgi:2-haloacid dehalogenase
MPVSQAPIIGPVSAIARSAATQQSQSGKQARPKWLRRARHDIQDRGRAMRLGDFKVLSFDCYGTLIDWESGLAAALQPLIAKSGRQVAREEALAAFARNESAQQTETPSLRYSELLALVYRRLAAEWGVAPDAAAAHAFGGSVGDWPEFPDSLEALAYLQRFYKLVILSNVDRASFARSNARLGVSFFAIHTAEDIGSYKPDPRNFRYLLDRLAESGHRPDDILHVAQSLYHDHMPANRCGLRSAWIDRRGGSAGGATPPPPANVHYDFRFDSMAALVAAHRAEHGGG